MKYRHIEGIGRRMHILLAERVRLEACYATRLRATHTLRKPEPERLGAAEAPLISSVRSLVLLSGKKKIQPKKLQILVGSEPTRDKPALTRVANGAGNN